MISRLIVLTRWGPPSQNFGEDKLREEIARLQEEKNAYQNVAKESLKKVLQEKLEAVRKLQELERYAVPRVTFVVFAGMAQKFFFNVS